MHKNMIRFLIFASVVTVCLASKAQAATFACTVTSVYWGNNGQLNIKCVSQPAAVANGFYNSNACAAVPATVDDRKSWETLATSALLSGKALTVEYDTGALCPAAAGVIGSIAILR